MFEVRIVNLFFLGCFLSPSSTCESPLIPSSFSVHRNVRFFYVSFFFCFFIVVNDDRDNDFVVAAVVI